MNNLTIKSRTSYLITLIITSFFLLYTSLPLAKTEKVKPVTTKTAVKSKAAAAPPKITLELSALPWHLDADGRWTTVVYVANTDKRVDLSASTGEVFSVGPWVYNTSAITVTLPSPSPVTVTAKGHKSSGYGSLTLASPADSFSGLQLAAKAVGPYLVNLGWAWLDKSQNIQQYQLARQVDESGTYWNIATLNPQATTYHDNNVRAGHNYSYRLTAITNRGASVTTDQSVTTQQEMANFPPQVMRGKGVTLFFASQPGAPYYYKTLDPVTVVQQAAKMGLKYIQLRTAYGGYSHFLDAGQMRWLNALLEETYRHGISLIAWSIPQKQNTRAMASDIAVASYVSPSGNTFEGMATDLEIGPDYIRDVKTAKQQIADYVRFIRMAVGSDYLISAIVLTPVEGWNNSNYPFQELAQYANIFQPMEFWHTSPKRKYPPEVVAAIVSKSVTLTKELARRDTYVNVIGQILDLGGTGAPSPQEITTALQAAKDSGALGVSFFNWHDELFQKNGDLGPLAQAVQNFDW